MVIPPPAKTGAIGIIILRRGIEEGLDPTNPNPATTAAEKMEGQDKVIAAAQHIIKSLATSKNSADDMIRILSGFDNRLSTLFPSESESESPVDAAEKVILRWDSDSHLWESSPDEVDDYLAAVDEIVSLAADGAVSGDLRIRVENLLQIAMSHLEDDFRRLMIGNTVPLQPRCLFGSIGRISLSDDEDDERNPPEPSLEDWEDIDLIHPEAVSDLNQIAHRMILSGYGKELCQVYCCVRRETLDECLSVLGVDRISIDEVQKLDWTSLSDKMNKWIQSWKVVVRVLLVEEKRLCHRIFDQSHHLKHECFIESARGCVMQLLNFGGAIAIVERSPEKVFSVIDMHKAVTDLLPGLHDLFSTDSSISIEAEDVLNRLGDVIRATLAELGNAIRKEPSRKLMQGCEIHPITRYVMNYLKLVVVYRSSLDSLLVDSREDSSVFDCDEGAESKSPTGRCLLSLVSNLESNLDDKSKLYEDGGMQYVFSMNNLLYIVQKVKDSELQSFLGDYWIRKRRGLIRQYSTSYLRTSWAKILSYLKDDGLSSSGGCSSGFRAALKERFKSFNSAFEELHRTQTTWKVPDAQLREELKISISEKIIPAYRSFMGRFGSQLEGGRHAAKYIKYSSEDLENHLSGLFEGSPAQFSYHRRKLSS